MFAITTEKSALIARERAYTVRNKATYVQQQQKHQYKKTTTYDNDTKIKTHTVLRVSTNELNVG